MWFVSGSVLNVDSSGDFTMSVESEDPYNDGSDRLTILALNINFIRTPPIFIRTCTDEYGNPIT